MFPLCAPVWLAGLWFYFFGEKRKTFSRAGMGMARQHLDHHGLQPERPLRVASIPAAVRCRRSRLGAVARAPRRAVSQVCLGRRDRCVRLSAHAFAIPVLPVETYIRYAEALHFQPPKIETHRLGPLPQILADQFGWQEMTATVVAVYRSLPPDVQAKTAIFGQNYGQAGAIDLFRPQCNREVPKRSMAGAR
jgi:hypothetical protein